MQKKLVKHGNSLALVIDKPILELLKIEEDTPLEITTNGDALVVLPARSKERQKRFREAMERTSQKYADAFKRLAQ